MTCATSASEHVQRRVHDALIPGAAAEMSAESVPQFCLLDWRAIALALQFEQRNHHAGRAVSALQAVMRGECRLDRVQRAIRRCDPLDGGDRMAIGLDGEHE